MRHLPVKRFASQPATAQQLDRMVAKIVEFNGKMADPLNDDQLRMLDNVKVTLQNKSRYHSTKFTDSQARVLTKLMRWPSDSVFPALDLARAVLCHPDGGRVLCSAAAFTAAPAMLDEVCARLQSEADSMPIVVTSLRVLACSACRAEFASTYLLPERVQDVLSVVRDAVAPARAYGGCSVKTVAGALGDLLLNLAGLVLDTIRGRGTKGDAVAAVGPVAELAAMLLEAQVQASKKSPDGILATLLAVGTFAQQQCPPAPEVWSAAHQNADTLVRELVDRPDLLEAWEECQRVGL